MTVECHVCVHSSTGPDGLVLHDLPAFYRHPLVKLTISHRVRTLTLRHAPPDRWIVFATGLQDDDSSHPGLAHFGFVGGLAPLGSHAGPLLNI